MTATVHPTAIVADGATLGDGVVVGPYCMVSADAVLGARVHLKSHVVIEGKTHKGMLSIGFNPTVNNYGANRSIEVNIFGFDRDIYKSKILINFRKRMRDEKKFENVYLLAQQLEIDKEMALRILK